MASNNDKTPKISKQKILTLKEQLIEANRAYIDCIEKNYLPKFLKGETVNIEDFCKEEYSHMMTLDKKVYPNTQLHWTEKPNDAAH